MSAKVNQLVHDLVSQGRWDEANSVLVRWAQQAPDDPDAQLQCGTLAYVIGRFSEAEKYLRNSLSRQDNADAHYYLGLTLTKLNRPQDAMSCFRDACDRREGFATAHLQWGMVLLQMNSYRGALGRFRQAFELNPRLVAAAYQAGIACYQLGQYQDAVEFFAEACEKDPSLAEAFNGLGVTLCALNQHEKALGCFGRAWELNNNLAIVQRNWAAALVNLGRLDEAAKHYQEAINLPPKVLDARERALIYNDWGVNLYRQGRPDDASERLLHAVSIDPGLLDSRLNLGIINNAMQEYEVAADAFERALEIDPEMPVTNFHLGVSYFLLGDFPRALERFAVAAKQQDKNPILDLWTGYAFMAIGNHQAAEPYFRRVVNINPDSYIALDALGICLSMQRRDGEAVETFKQCLKLNNEYGLAHVHLAKTHEASGRDSEAMLEYKVAIQKDPNCLLPEKELLDELIAHSSFELAYSKSQKLLQITPNDQEAQLVSARSLRAQNKLDEASQVLAQLLQQSPHNGAGRVLLGQIFLSQGKLLEADEQFRTGSELSSEGDVALYYGWGKTLGLLGMHELAIEKFKLANEIDPYDGDTYEAWGATLKVLGRYQDAAEVFKRASEYL
ncbi:MAG TPA: tetratricopeptide repeat protein [Candidatus Obscuribacterales bacterium]